MKTYEEMARDVLRRRDEQLLSITQTSQINPPPEVVYPAAPKKRGKLGLLPKIAIPCAAAVLIGAVGLTAWNNLHRGRFINPGLAEGDQSGIADDDESKLQYIFNEFDSTPTHTAAEQRESIYKGGKTEIYINEVEEWKFYPTPELLAEDFRPIDDDKINNYYGLEFDRLSRVFPEWESLHEPFGVFEHDEDDGFVVSHGLIYNLNRITYTTKDGDIVDTAASLRKYDTATIENAKPSVINGFDAMVYSCISNGDRCYAADIEMGHSYVTIKTINVDEEEFLNILDVYTAPDEGSEDNRNNDHNQTMEDKINILDEAPKYIKTNSWPYSLESDETFVEGSELIRFSMSELNDFYGINFGCLSQLHPDWLKMYNERNLGIYIYDYDSVTTENMASSGGRVIVWTKNTVGYATTENGAISISAWLCTLSEEEMGSSVVNGYNAVIFRKYGNYDDIVGYGAAVQMDDTLIFITAANQSEDEFIDLVREYTSEASKYRRSSKPLPEQNESTTFTAYNSVEYEIQCEVDFSVPSMWLKRIYNEKYAKKVENLRWETVGCDESLDYLSDFFESDALPVDEQYIHDLKWYISDGHFTCTTAKGAKAYTPVDGKVVAVCDGWYNGGLGNAVAVEFDNTSYFIMGHLDEVNVEVGDSVKAGEVLGVCGQTGAVVVEEDEALLSLITLVKLGD